MRLHRSIALGLAVIAAGACEHDEIITLIERDGTGTIPVIQLNTAAAGGFLGGTRLTNRFLATGFDTSITDAFARQSTQPAMRGTDPNGFGYTTSGRPNIVFCPPGVRNGLTDRYLPRLVSDSARITTFYGSAQPVCYIVQAAHPFNGGLFWEFWVNFTTLDRSENHVMGLARYAVDQRGALDIAQILQSGTVTQPDSLVFQGGFAPAGYRGTTQYGDPCPDPAGAYDAVAGANPHFVGTGVSTAGTGSIEIDVTICRGTVWANDFGAATTPVGPNNDTPLGVGQYNFLVLWKALPDSTPDYTRPVARIQIGPLLTTAGAVVNNSYAPLPTTAFTAAQLALLPGGIAVPDTIRVTATNLLPLASQTYQPWLVETTSGQATRVTGDVIRLSGTTPVDTLVGVNAFNLASGMTGATVVFDFAPHVGTAWNAMVLAIGSAGAATLPASQPLWNPMVTEKLAGGAIPLLQSALTFGSFNGGTNSLQFGAAGTGTGGIFGRELREDIRRIPRPPVGYFYEAWLVSSGGTTAPMSLGPLLSPYPGLLPLTDADVSTAPPVSGVEITQAALRHEAASVTFYCAWDRVQVRLAPKANAGALPPTILLSGTNPREGCP
jgi:hypothetical protein